MSALPSLRLLQAHELAAVAGGDIIVNGPRPSEPIDPRLLDALRFNFNWATIEELGLGTGGLATPNADAGDQLNPDEDSDGDGIPNWEDDPIEVVGDPVDLANEIASLREIASWHVDYFLISGAAMFGFAGLSGWPGAAAAVAELLALQNRDDMIESLAQNMIEGDMDDDGIVNGSIFGPPGLEPGVEPGVVYTL